MKKEYNQSFKGVNNQSHSTTYNQGYSLEPMDLSERINARMQALGLTQETLAKRAGVSQTTIHKLLSGKSRRTRYLNPLAKALRCSPEWLEGGDDPQPEPTSPDDQIATLLGVASPRSRTALERIAAALAEGLLTEADLELLEHIAERLSGRAATSFDKLREKADHADHDPG